MESKARLIIADSYNLLAETFKFLLEPEFEIVAIVNDGRALLQQALALKPDGIILDVSLPLLNGLDAAEQIGRRPHPPKLVFLTANSSPQVAALAFQHGASAFVLKQSGAKEFTEAIRSAMRGESYLSHLIARETVDYLLHQSKPMRLENSLTPRQIEILQLLSEGRSMKQVGDILEINAGTVAFHKYRMMKELRIESNAELLQFAIRNHMRPMEKRGSMTVGARNEFEFAD